MNIFENEKINLKEKMYEEITDILHQNENIKIERIISTGQTTDWMAQKENEFVLLVQGNAVIEFENRKINLKKGDTILIKKNERHRVVYTSENPHCIWICVFFN